MNRAEDLRSRAAVVPFGGATPARGDVPETPKSLRDPDHTPQPGSETSPVCTAKRSLSGVPHRSFHNKNLWSSGSVIFVNAGPCRVIGIVFGYLPARHASRLDPSEVLFRS